jgi:hypothetical protein
LRLLQTVQIIHGRDGATLNDASVAARDFRELIEQAQRACEFSGLTDAAQSLSFICLQLNKANRKQTASSLATEARHACEQIQAALESRVYLAIAKDKAVEMLANKDFLGAEVRAAFPSAVEDIEEAGNCMALECSTAAVFHFMRILEWGL